MQLHGKISIPIPQSHCPWGSALVLTPPLCVQHPQASVPCPGDSERKQQLLGAHLLTQTWVCTSGLQWRGPAGSCNQLWRFALVGVPPSGHGGRSWSVGVVCVGGGGGPASLRASQQWHLRFQADHASCRGTPSLASPLSRHLCCIHTANSVPLPGSVLPTPHFSIQPPPTSVDSHPRQGHLGLIPKEALGWAALRPPEPSQAGGKAQKGAPPSASGCQRSRPVGEGVIMAAAPLARHSTRMPCFCGVPGFFCRHSPLWSSLLLSLQAVFSQPIAVPSLGLHSKPHFPAPSPPSQQVTHNSGWNAQS